MRPRPPLWGVFLAAGVVLALIVWSAIVAERDRERERRGRDPALRDAAASRAAVVTAEMRATEERREANGKAWNVLKPRLRPCYEAALAKSPAIESNALVMLEIAADGQVQSARIIEGGAASETAYTCPLRELRSDRFPASDGGTTTLRFPIHFETTDQDK